MPKTKISEYSTTNSDNTDIESINIAEGCAPSGINNAIRELMVHLKEFQTGASGDAFTFAGGVLISGTANTITGNVLMSGTNTITGSTTATFAAGAVGTPSIAAHGDTNTGIFFPAADTIAFAEGGAEAMRINSDSQVVTTAGTVSLPAITTTGDLNTGIFFPAADTIAFAEGGAEAMRIDSSGNLGLGVTPSAWASGWKAIQVASASNNPCFINCSSSSAFGLINNGYYNGSNYIYQSSTNASQYYQESGAHIWTSASSGTAGGTITFTECARITSGGEVYIAGTTDQGAYNLQVNGTGVWGAGAYVNGSDARIKEDVAPIDSGLDVVTRLNPVTYRYKEDWSKDQSTQTGFIAQELLVALEGKNYVDGVVQQGGSEGYYSVAYQNIIPILTKAIQELKAEVDALKAELANK